MTYILRVGEGRALVRHVEPEGRRTSPPFFAIPPAASWVIVFDPCPLSAFQALAPHLLIYTAPDDNIHFDLIEGDPGYA
ncbi:MAG TPA: hypothetical protein VNZ26_05430 [Vicinamibacterales bacterium]|nr:hypothetical protein [Vicinamibacterales bacterium]